MDKKDQEFDESEVGKTPDDLTPEEKRGVLEQMAKRSGPPTPPAPPVDGEPLPDPNQPMPPPVAPPPTYDALQAKKKEVRKKLKASLENTKKCIRLHDQGRVQLAELAIAEGVTIYVDANVSSVEYGDMVAQRDRAINEAKARAAKNNGK